MALAERPMLTPEEERVWHSLGIELEEVPEVSPIGDTGRDALARMFELLERHRPAWQRDALCIEYADTVTWFPARGESVQPAKDVCAQCLVAEECHAYAVEIDAPAGIWAGTSARSRQRNAASVVQPLVNTDRLPIRWSENEG